MQRRAYLHLVCILVGGLLFSGCTSRYGEQRTKVNYYPQCYEPVAQLRKDENSTGKSTAAGAAGGALLGALIGGLATGKVEGALAGAVAGGAAGAVGGNIYGKSQETQREYRAGQITRLELQDRYNEIRSGLEETAYILKDTSSAMAQRSSEYERVLASDYTASQPASPAASTPKKKPAVRQASISPQASEWKSSRKELESTRSDVDARMSSYEETVNNLLG